MQKGHYIHDYYSLHVLYNIIHGKDYVEGAQLN